MHRSQFAGPIIDCKTDDLPSAADFWSEALGYEKKRKERNSPYVSLQTPDSGPYFEVQKVAHASRVHLDIESDNIEAEAVRLERLGARRVAEIKGWQVMEAPTGQRFCIVPPISKDFARTANKWGDS